MHFHSPHLLWLLALLAPMTAYYVWRTLRGGAALAVAALGAEGESTIYGLRHIRRGYADLVRDLTALDAKVYLAEKE